MQTTCLNILLFLGLLLSTAGTLLAQTNELTQTVKGVIQDQASEAPIMAANILVLGSDPVIGAATDLDGSFRLENVPVGRHSLRISCLGYEEAYIHELEVGSGKEVVLRIGLTESLITMEEVVVKADRLNGTPNNEMASVSARSFSVEQTKRYAAAINDPARMAMSFAGVSSQDDGANEIVIRGNSPRGLLWRMEGVEIPSPNHFSDLGASGGGVSALSVNMLSNSDFLVSAFPAEYGNALSGVFDIKLRNGNNEKREYAFQAGLLGLDMAAEGPIGEKGGASYLANYRYSTLGILGELGVFELEEETTFQDFAFKVQIPTTSNGYWSIWGLGGLSSSIFRDSLSEYDYISNRGVVGVNNRTYLTKDAYVESSLSYSVNQLADDDIFKPTNYFEREQFVNYSLRASVLYNRKFNARTTLRTGLIGSRLSYDFEQWDEDDDSPRVVSIDENGSTSSTQAYAQIKHRLGTTLHLNAGVHATWLAIGDQLSVEPRLGMRWNLRPGHVLSAGAGLHSRLDPLPVYFAQVQNSDGSYSQPNKTLELPKAGHAVLGYEWRFHPRWRAQAEVYYQHLYEVAIASPHMNESYARSASALNFNEGYVTDSLFSDGTGRNYGLDITLERFFTDGWYALGTVSVYRSLYTARDGVERSSRFDGRFVCNALVGKEWTVGKRQVNQFGINLRGTMAGGNRETPIDLEASQAAGYTVRKHEDAWGKQLPYYLRADLRLSYRRNKARTSSVWSLDLQNVTNRENIYGNYFSSSLGTIEQETQLGLIPVLNYRLEF